ncbi:MAG: XRE family transcriptional regulator [Gammaproteobacteria bacterium]|nr:XRE family transcriptional regulator [Gammaproteobacteria bacterium]
MNTETYHSVWDAISDSREEAVNLKLRSQLMDILTTYIRNEGITQKEAGLRFGIPRSRVSELVNERISKFTIDKLVNMAARVGLSVLHVDHSAVSPDPSAPNTDSHRTIHTAYSSNLNPSP